MWWVHALLWWATLVSAAASLKKQPNIVQIVIDDLGWNDLGFRNPSIDSPTINTLANSGVILTDYHVFHVCSPTRSSFMTGRIPYHNGLHTIIRPKEAAAISRNYTFLPEVLRAGGYSTHMAGKWHLGFYSKDYIPTARGFDTYLGYLEGAEDYFKHTRQECKGVPGYDFLKSVEGGTYGPARQYAGNYSAYVLADEVARQIRGTPEHTPGYYYVPFQSVHAPEEAPAGLIEHYRKANAPRPIFTAMVKALDEGIATILTALRETNRYNNTFFAVTTDNGGCISSEGNNWPLRGAKTTFWEGGTRGMAFAAWGSDLGPKKSGENVTDLMHASDWYRTLLAVAGLSDKTPPTAVDSMNMLPTLMNGVTGPRDTLVHDVDAKGTEGKLRWKQYNLYLVTPGQGCDSHDGWTKPPVNSTDSSHLVPSNGDKCSPTSPCLYDVVSDVVEEHNIASDHPDIVKEMTTMLAKAACPSCSLDRAPAGSPTLCDFEEKNQWVGPWVE